MNSAKDPTPKPHQRVGAVSNAHAGREFEQAAKEFLAAMGLDLEFNFSAQIGHTSKKGHRFDLGSQSPPVLVECKSYTWTSGGNTPSAKLRSLNEAILHFIVAPPEYRKLLIVQQSMREGKRESLAEYYIRTQGHLIPVETEIWELDPITLAGKRLPIDVPVSSTKVRGDMREEGANDMPNTQDFVDAIRQKIRMAELRNAPYVDINSGELHREIGGYPGPKAAMPSCCNAMYSEQKATDQILSKPPKGKGASLTIRYKLPR